MVNRTKWANLAAALGLALALGGCWRTDRDLIPDKLAATPPFALKNGKATYDTWAAARASRLTG